MAFSGWPDAALDFYDDLEQDNSKAFWTKHKAVYEESVLGPMTELGEELAGEFGEVKIFRPYRDVRFSADKAPYKTHIGAVIGTGYVQLSARGLAAGHGMHQMAPDQLDRYRQAVAHDITGPLLERTSKAIAAAGFGIEGIGELKKAPRGYPADHRRIELLRYKGIIAWQEWEYEPWLATSQAKDRVLGFLRATKPLVDWLGTHVGPSQLTESRRR